MDKRGEKKMTVLVGEVGAMSIMDALDASGLRHCVQGSPNRLLKNWGKGRRVCLRRRIGIFGVWQLALGQA